MRRFLVRLAFCLLAASPITLVRAQPPAPSSTSIWDAPSILAHPPTATWGEEKDGIREVFYEGAPLQGKPTRVYAYYARPTSGNGPFPAMLLVHGGGGKAFREWAELWAKRGYVALAMDLAGHGPDGKRLADGGPEQDDGGKFHDFTDAEVGTMWTYHAVAAVLRGHALLKSRPEVDANRIGVTGISWGGYLTCIIAGVDPEVKVAVPVYGCGFLDDDSYWIPRFAAMSPAQRNRWVSDFDPSRWLPGVKCPTLFVNGTNDFAYPMGSYRKSYRSVSAPRTLCVTVNMPHGHQQGWAPIEIGLFVDSILTGGKPLATLSAPRLEGQTLSASLKSAVPIRGAKLHFTTDSGPWQKRQWTTRDASIADGRISAELPSEPAVTAAFLTVTDERGAVVSTEHVEPWADRVGPR